MGKHHYLLVLGQPSILLADKQNVATWVSESLSSLMGFILLIMFLSKKKNPAIIGYGFRFCLDVRIY